MHYRYFEDEFQSGGGESDDISRLKLLANSLYDLKETFKEKFSRNHVARNVLACTLDAASTVAGVSLYGVEKESNKISRAVMQRYGPPSLFLWDMVFTYPINYGVSLAYDSLMSVMPEGRVRSAADWVKRTVNAKSYAESGLAIVSLLKYYVGASNLSRLISSFVPEPHSTTVDLGIYMLLFIPYAYTLMHKDEKDDVEPSPERI